MCHNLVKDFHLNMSSQECLQKVQHLLLCTGDASSFVPFEGRRTGTIDLPDVFEEERAQHAERFSKLERGWG